MSRDAVSTRRGPTDWRKNIPRGERLLPENRKAAAELVDLAQAFMRCALDRNFSVERCERILHEGLRRGLQPRSPRVNEILDLVCDPQPENT